MLLLLKLAGHFLNLNIPVYWYFGSRKARTLASGGYAERSLSHSGLIGLDAEANVVEKDDPRVSPPRSPRVRQAIIAFQATACLPVRYRLPTERTREMNEDRIKGAGHEIKGAVKEAAGKVTGNRETQADGVAEKTVGKLQNKINESGRQPQARVAQAWGRPHAPAICSWACGQPSPGKLLKIRWRRLPMVPLAAQRAAFGPVGSRADRSRRCARYWTRHRG